LRERQRRSLLNLRCIFGNTFVVGDISSGKFESVIIFVGLSVLLKTLMLLFEFRFVIGKEIHLID
jgi:hypothetical protein